MHRINRLKVSAAVDYLEQSLWAIPSVGLVLALLLAEITPLIGARIEDRLPGLLLSGVGPESVRAMLSAIATATITLTGLVFSVTMLVLQLATSQLSPRVMRTFLRDRGNQVVLALFIGTFSYALLALRDVGAEDGGGSPVPTLTTWLVFALALSSVGGFVYYVHHVAQAIRPVNVIARVGTESEAAIDRLYPDVFEDPGLVPALPDREPDHLITSPYRGGVVTGVSAGRLMDMAAEQGCVLELTAMVGDFVGEDAVLFRAWGPLSDEAREELPAMVHVGKERTMMQDAAFGFRQLVDIAERALSPGVNDPTTAVQVIDRLHDLLRRLAVRAIPSPYGVGEDGRLLIILPRPDWDDYVALAMDEIRIYGRSSLQVTRRLRYLVEDVASVAPPSRRVALHRQAALLDEAAPIAFELEHDRLSAARPGRQGHGP